MDSKKNIPDKKRDYLVRTLSRTRRKDYENYVVNAVYHKLDNLEIKPVTQQYVNVGEGKHHLIDLYFPQINYGVECDEAHHQNQKDNDMKRELNIKDALTPNETGNIFSSIALEEYNIGHIDMSKDITEINKEINNILNEIKKRINKNQLEKWDINQKDSEIAVKKGKILINDNLRFNTIIEACECFGLNYPNQQHSCFEFKKNPDYRFWFPKLAINGKSVKNGWKNILSSDWTEIKESNDEDPDALGIFEQEKNKDKRITFARFRNNLGQMNYRFVGVFQYNEKLSKIGKYKTYKRIQEEFDLTPYSKNGD